MIEKEADIPILEEAMFEFSQEPNCVDGGDCESLQIKCMSSLGIDRNGDCFYVIKTEGWSINSVDDLQQLINRISKVIKTHNK